MGGLGCSVSFYSKLDILGIIRGVGVVSVPRVGVSRIGEVGTNGATVALVNEIGMTGVAATSTNRVGKAGVVAISVDGIGIKGDDDTNDDDERDNKTFIHRVIVASYGSGYKGVFDATLSEESSDGSNSESYLTWSSDKKGEITCATCACLDDRCISL
nr:hypothetical protein [Tanacetum cinerariifolium]